MARHRIFDEAFATIYPMYVAKVERKGHTTAELDQVLTWVTGYDADALAGSVASGVTLEEFFADAPAAAERVPLVTGVICGHRVEETEDPLMRQIRAMDKVVDEVARGKRMSSILRGTPG